MVRQLVKWVELEDSAREERHYESLAVATLNQMYLWQFI